MANPVSHDRSGFKLYLEGVEVPFIAIRIQEGEGTFPSAVLQLPATLSCLKVLPGTIVQVEGPQKLSNSASKIQNKRVASVLLFEGEVNSVVYAKGASGRSLQLSCSSLLARVQQAKAIAVDSLAPKLHKDSSMVFTNVGGTVGSPNVTNEQTTNNNPVPNSKWHEELLLGDRFGGILGAALKAIEEIIPTGDINKIVTNVWEFFNKSDFYFHITDTSFRLKSSMIAFPNKSSDALSAITASVLKDMLAKMKQGSTETDTYNLYEVLWGILDMVRYQFTAPAAPTGGIQIQGSPSSEEGVYEPLRMFFTPDLDTGPPALCNVFFPDQIVNFSYQRSFFGEPTRSVTYLDWNIGASGGITKYGINYLIPDMSINTITYKVPDLDGNAEGEDESDYVPTFQPEEAYQGCRPIFSAVDGWFVTSANNYYKQEDRTVNHMTNPDNKPAWATAMKHEALKTWMLNKHGKTKSLTIQSDWNPSRLVGAPGVLIDPGFPSLTGVVSNIATEINANGSASSSVTFRSVRAMYDEDEYAYKESSASLWPEAIKSTSSDITPTLHDFLYDPQLYLHTEIGRYVYTYMMYGNVAEGSPLESYSITETSAGKVWDVDNNSFSKMQNPHLHVDDSILNYLRLADDKNALVLLPDMVPSEGEAEDTPEELYAKRLYLAIRYLKDEYLGMAQGEEIDQYMTNLNYRQLVPFTDYLGYIQATNTNTSTDYKNSIQLLANSENASSTFQTLIQQAVALAGDKGPEIKKLKLNKGVDSKIPSIQELKETISALKAKKEELIEDKVVQTELAVTEFEARSGLTSGKANYTIKDGDELTAIASRYGTTVAAILDENPYPGPAIQSLTSLVSGELIVIPVELNPADKASLSRQLKALRESLTSAYTDSIEGITAELERQEDYLADLVAGKVPNASIANNSIEAIYRPYDVTRKAHVLIAFNELIYSTDKVKVTK